MLVMIPSWMKRAWGHLFFYGGIFHLVRFINNIAGKRVTIVTYHRVTDDKITGIEASLPYLFTTAGSFQKHLRFYRKWYRVITFGDLHRYANDGTVPRNALIITFDDGYADNYHTAYPFLLTMGLPATFFLPVDKIGMRPVKAYWWDRLYHYFTRLRNREDAEHLLPGLDPRLASWYRDFLADPPGLFARLNERDDATIDELLDGMQRELCFDCEAMERANATIDWQQIIAMNGHIEFGSHTCSHCNLTTIDPVRRTDEIRRSKMTIETHTNRQVIAFSYPCGKYEDALKSAVRDAGYDYAVTTEAGVNDLRDCYALKRINIWEGTGMTAQGHYTKGYFAFKLAGF
jgi:peptidoglycan/xylan/chitin deacetylase (PgdA/CDA1 family)